MSRLKIAIVGAGSSSFGPGTIRDIMLSDALTARDLELVLMDKRPDPLPERAKYAEQLMHRLGRRVKIATTTDLSSALEGVAFVVAAIEVDRYHYWSMDFHIPRQFGFRQPYGENGGPGGLFHALRNMKPMLEIARRMEQLCPDATLLNFTNPEAKLCEAISRLTSIQAVGLCHGVGGGMNQIARILGRKVEDLEMAACGLNHITFFQTIRDRATGEDLYPKLREAEREMPWLEDWHELGLSRILLRRFGLWSSPGANHIGEYIRWADEFVPAELQYYYDPADEQPWDTHKTPQFLYHIGLAEAVLGWTRPKKEAPKKEEKKAGEDETRTALEAGKDKPAEEPPIHPSGEFEALIMESLACGVRHHLDAINVPNRGAIPNLPDDTVVEVPAVSDGDGLHPVQMAPLPEALAAILRTQASIQQLLTEAFDEQSREKLLQTILTEPVVDSYQRATAMMDRMIELQKDILPPLK